MKLGKAGKLKFALQVMDVETLYFLEDGRAHWCWCLSTIEVSCCDWESADLNLTE